MDLKRHWNVKNVHKLQIFNRMCIQDIVHVSWSHQLSSTEVKRRILGKDSLPVDETVNLHSLMKLTYITYP